MTGRFADCIVFVAGASGGINLAIARAFGLEGARVAILSRNADRISTAAQGLRDDGIDAIGYAGDVRDHDAVAHALESTATQWGPIDVLISGAAGNFLATAASLSANAFRTVVDIDLIGTFNVFHAAFPHLRKPGAALIAISAGQAVHPMARQVHACAAKAGVNMLVKCLALEWGPAGIRVNAISPGPIADTEGMSRLAADPAAEAALKARLALRDYGTKDDVAAAALYLAGDTARYITGAILNVDGGNDLGDASGDALPALAEPA